MIVVEIPGEPVAKGRPRFRAITARDGRSFVNTYTPAKTKAYERALAMMAKVAMRGEPPLEGPLRVKVTAFLTVPASWSNKKRDAALAGTVCAISRPDADNYQKAAWDALNSIVWLDDSQIVDAHMVKIYDENPRLKIEIEPIGAFAMDGDDDARSQDGPQNGQHPLRSRPGVERDSGESGDGRSRRVASSPDSV